MKPALILAVLVLASACKRTAGESAATAPVREIVAGVPMIDFEETAAKFSCRVPANWGVRASEYLPLDKGISMSGGNWTHISIYKYPEFEKGLYKDAQAYAETFWMTDPKGKQPEITKEKIGETTVLRFHQELMPYPKRTRNDDKPERTDYALIPVKDGFYEIVHRAPIDTCEKTLPVFDAVVKSFKPKS